MIAIPIAITTTIIIFFIVIGTLLILNSPIIAVVILVPMIEFLGTRAAEPPAPWSGGLDGRRLTAPAR